MAVCLNSPRVAHAADDSLAFATDTVTVTQGEFTEVSVTVHDISSTVSSVGLEWLNILVDVPSYAAKPVASDTTKLEAMDLCVAHLAPSNKRKLYTHQTVDTWETTGGHYAYDHTFTVRLFGCSATSNTSNTSMDVYYERNTSVLTSLDTADYNDISSDTSTLVVNDSAKCKRASVSITSGHNARGFICVDETTVPLGATTAVYAAVYKPGNHVAASYLFVLSGSWPYDLHFEGTDCESSSNNSGYISFTTSTDSTEKTLVGCEITTEFNIFLKGRFERLGNIHYFSSPTIGIAVSSSAPPTATPTPTPTPADPVPVPSLTPASITIDPLGSVDLALSATGADSSETYRAVVTITHGTGDGLLDGCGTNGVSSQNIDLTHGAGNTLTGEATFYGCSPGTVQIGYQIQEQDGTAWTDVGDQVTRDATINEGPLFTYSSVPTSITEATTDDTTIDVTGATSSATYRAVVTVTEGSDKAKIDACSGVNALTTKNITLTGSGTTRTGTFTVAGCITGSMTLSATLQLDDNGTWTNIGPVVQAYSISGPPSPTVTLPGLDASLPETTSSPITINLTGAATTFSYRAVVSVTAGTDKAKIDACSGGNALTTKTIALSGSGTTRTGSFALYGCDEGTATISVQPQRQVSGVYAVDGSALVQTATVAAAPTVSLTSVPSSIVVDSHDSTTVNVAGVQPDVEYRVALSITAGSANAKIDACSGANALTSKNLSLIGTGTQRLGEFIIYGCEAGTMSLTATLEYNDGSVWVNLSGSAASTDYTISSFPVAAYTLTDVAASIDYTGSDEITISVTEADPPSTYRAVVSITTGSNNVKIRACTGVMSVTLQSLSLPGSGQERTGNFTVWGCNPGTATLSVQLQRLRGQTWDDESTAVTQTLTVNAIPSVAFSSVPSNITADQTDETIITATNVRGDLNYRTVVTVTAGTDKARIDGCGQQGLTTKTIAMTGTGSSRTASVTLFACLAGSVTLSAKLQADNGGWTDIGTAQTQGYTIVDPSDAALTISYGGTNFAFNGNDSATLNVTGANEGSTYRAVASITVGTTRVNFVGCGDAGATTSTIPLTGTGTTRTGTVTFYGCIPGAATLSVELQRLKGDSFESEGTDATQSLTVVAVGEEPTISLSAAGIPVIATETFTFAVSMTGASASKDYVLTINLPSGVGFDDTCSHGQRDYLIENPSGGAFTSQSMTAYICIYNKFTVTFNVRETTSTTPITYGEATFTGIPPVPETPIVRIHDLVSSLTVGASDSFVVQTAAKPGTYRIITRITGDTDRASFTGFCQTAIEQFDTIIVQSTPFGIRYQIYGCRAGTVTVTTQAQPFINGQYVTIGATASYRVTLAAPQPPTIDLSNYAVVFTDSTTGSIGVTGLQPRLTYSLSVTLPPGLGFDQVTCQDRYRAYHIESAASFVSPSAPVYACHAGNYTITAEVARSSASPTIAYRNVTASLSLPTIHALSIDGLESSIVEGASDEFSISVSGDPGSYRLVTTIRGDSTAASLSGYCDNVTSQTDTLILTGTSQAVTHSVYGCESGTVTIEADLTLLSGNTWVYTRPPVTQAITIETAAAPFIDLSDIDNRITNSDAFSVNVSGLLTVFDYTLNVSLPVGMGFDQGLCRDRTVTYSVPSGTTWTTPELMAYVCDSGSYTVVAQLTRPEAPTVYERHNFVAIDSSAGPDHTSVGFTDLSATISVGSVDDFDITLTAPVDMYRMALSIVPDDGIASFDGFCAGGRTTGETTRVFEATNESQNLGFSVYPCREGSVTIHAQLQKYDTATNQYVSTRPPAIFHTTVEAATLPTITADGLASEWTSRAHWTLNIRDLQPTLTYTVAITLPSGLGWDSDSCESTQRIYNITGAASWTSEGLTTYACASGARSITASLTRGGDPTVYLSWTKRVVVAYTGTPNITPGGDAQFLPDPDTFIIHHALGYGSLQEAGDLFFLLIYEIQYDSPPIGEWAVSTSFTAGVTAPGASVTFTPYSPRPGWGYGAVGGYLSNDAARAARLSWGLPATASLQGDPVVVVGLPSVSIPLHWVQQSYSLSALEQDVREAARLLQNDAYFPNPLIESTLLTAAGTAYFSEVSNDLNTLIPDIYPVTFSDLSSVSQAAGTSFAENLPGRLDGGLVDADIFDDLGGLFGVSGTIAAFVVFLCGAGLLSAGAAKFAHTSLLTVPIITLVLIFGTAFGWIPFQATIAFGFLGALVTGFILFLRRA